MTTETAREEAVNPLLGQLLRQRGIPARAERRSRGDTPDIRYELPTGELVLLECKWESGHADLLDQLNDRLTDFPDAIARVGVLYPDAFKHVDDIQDELEHTLNLQWFLHSSRQQTYADPPIRDGGLDQLADHLRPILLEVEGYDLITQAADDVRLALEDAAASINKHANIGRRISEVIAEADKESDRAAALRIGCLVLFNALAFQDRLSALNEDVPTAQEVLNAGAADLRDIWLTICREIDYVPVFEIAAEILGILSDAPGNIQNGAIVPLVRAVRKTARIEGHDLAGRLFHTLLSDAKFTGAYYTSVPAATILSRLVFEDWPKGVDWSNHELPSALNIADLACGTGTLLMAVAAEAERRHLNAGGSDARQLHKELVEQALHGYDVQLSAIHFAATSLAMLNPHIEFDRMNLYVMPLGVNGDQVSLGSLDFLEEGKAPIQHSLSAHAFGLSEQAAEQVTGGGLESSPTQQTAELPKLDLAIMNPPFTRAGLMLFGMLPQADRRKVQQELSRRLRSRSGSAIAGLGAAFVATAAPRLQPGEGRLALVLPATLCTGSSWQQTRSLIERDFKLDMVIASHDPLRWNFSDSTDLSEVLLIATRREVGEIGMQHRTTYVNLWQNPDSVLDAQRTADVIARTSPAEIESLGCALLSVGGQHVGEATSIPMSRYNNRKWAAIQFSRADLTRAALSLTETGEISLPGSSRAATISLCELLDIATIGPDRRRLIDGFERTSTITAYPMVEGHDTDDRTSMTCAPDAYLSPLAVPKGGQRPGYGDRLWQMSSRLLVAERLWLNTTRVLAMHCDQAVLSNVWWEVRVEDEETEKALAVWLNPTLGIISLLGQRTSTRAGWVASKKADLGKLPVLDPRELYPEQRSQLADLFDSSAHLSFERLPAMVDCPARKALDDGLSEILDLPDLAVLRRLLASEPVVSNQRL